MSETRGPWGFIISADIQSCDKCKVPDAGLYRLVPDRMQLSRTHTFVRIYNGETDLFGFIRIPIDKLPELVRMIECRNLIDGPESYADNYEYEDEAPVEEVKVAIREEMKL